MCLQDSKRKSNMALAYFIAIIFGIINGYANYPLLQNFGFLISDAFIKIFKCISLPLIALSIMVTLLDYNTGSKDKNIWKKTLFYTINTTIIAAAVTCILYYIISPSNISIADEKISTINSISENNYLGYLKNLIPSNIFSPFLEHQVMGALLISILTGIAIRYIPDENPRSAITYFFKGAHGIFLVITSWIVKVVPIALFGFITTTVVQMRNGVDMAGFTGYLSIILLANLIQGLVILPLFLYGNKIKPLPAMKGMFPALSVAFFSKSSAGTLPITMATIERNLGVSPKVSRFVLPLCTSINMNGCAAFIFATVIYLMQNNGIEINFVTMLIWIFIATIAAIGNAGVPMGCFFLSASLLTSMNIPITLLGLILPFYSIIDMLETALNVWSDSCVTKIIDHQEKLETNLKN